MKNTRLTILQSIKYLWLTIIFLSVLPTLYGLKACSGDGCMVRIAFLIGFPILVLSSILYFITRYFINKYRKHN